MSDKNDKKPPKRIRVTRLQEAQLKALTGIDAACNEMFYAVGFDAAEVPARVAGDIARLTRNHDVNVAEADHEPAGFIAWRDEAPGVAYIADLQVGPDYQRFGVASRLLQEMNDNAREKKLEHAVVLAWQKAPWAIAFYTARGFVQIDSHAPEKVRAWCAEREASGRPLTRPGEVALWTRLPDPPPEDIDADDF